MIPKDIVSDRGPQFVSRFWREFCELMGITVSLSSGFHPQTDGQSEKANQEVETKLRLVCSEDPSKWSNNLPWVEHAILCPHRPLASHLFILFMVFNLLCFLSRNDPPESPRPMPLLIGARELGPEPEGLLLGLQPPILAWPTVDGRSCLTTRLARRCGSPQKTFFSEWRIVNWHPGLSVRFPSPKSTPLQSASTYPRIPESTQLSVPLESNLTCHPNCSPPPDPHHPPGSLMVPQLMQSRRFSAPEYGARPFTTWWIGKAMAPRSGHGFQQGTY